MNWQFRKVQLSSLQGVVPGVISTLVVGACSLLGMMQPLEQMAQMQLFRLRPTVGWDDRIVVIGIDDRSLTALGRFPWRRDPFGLRLRYRYAQLLDKLSQSKPNVVAFDLLLPEPSADDAVFAAAMRRHGVVVLAQAWNSQGEALLPTPLLQDQAIAIGHVHKYADDSVNRKVAPLIKGVPTLGFAAAGAYSLTSQSIVLPSLNQRFLRLNWPASVQQLRQYSFSDVISGKVTASGSRARLFW